MLLLNIQEGTFFFFGVAGRLSFERELVFGFISKCKWWRRDIRLFVSQSACGCFLKCV